MFFIYFPCALVAAILIYVDSNHRKMPIWWGPLAFFAPMVVPLYLIKTRRKKSILPIVIFLSVFVLVGVGEGFLFSKFKEKTAYEKYSPVVQEVIQMANDIRSVVKKVNNIIGELEDKRGVSASPENIEEALVFIRSARAQMDQYTRVVANFNAASNEYHDRLRSEKLGWILYLQRYYKEKIVVKYLKSFVQYLQTFAAMLEYTKAHFYEIQGKEATARRNYDSYYLNYVRALERHERLDVARMRFQRNFLKQHPKLKRYLPSVLNRQLIDIWQKS